MAKNHGLIRGGSRLREDSPRDNAGSSDEADWRFSSSVLAVCGGCGQHEFVMIEESKSGR
jgi:hypothetical protein